MVGELATRFTWASVMIFDDEYRQRQAREKFPWGRDAPHLSTITLRDRHPQQQQQQGKKGQGGANRGAVGPSGKEFCIQFNRGQCSFGATTSMHVRSVPRTIQRATTPPPLLRRPNRTKSSNHQR
jgi:hypothetical protein